jgi:signal transduction histidine kinase
MTNALPRQQPLPATPDRQRSWPLQLFAAITMAVIVSVLLLHWPIPTTGLTIDVPTGIISEVEPGSGADRIGMRVGDQVLWVYGYPWSASDTQLWLFPLDWRLPRTVPLRIARDGQILHLLLNPDPPGLAAQASRLTWFALACLFWLTGYAIGVARRHSTMGSPLTAWFWIGVSGMLGVYHFAIYGSYPLSVLLNWVFITIIVPTGIAIHVWFPPRAIPPVQSARTRRWLVASILLLQVIGLIALVVWRPRVSAILDMLATLVTPALVLGMLCTSALLWRAYQRSTVAHTRRQIRLVASACLIIAGVWLSLRIIPRLFAYEPPASSEELMLVSGLLPLAYLAGAILPDLYRLDRALAWLGRHLITAAVLLAITTMVAGIVDIQGPIAAPWVAIFLVAGYAPLYRLGTQLLPARLRHTPPYQPLADAASRMTLTLEHDPLVRMLVSGVQATFGTPPIAFYQVDERDPTRLQLTIADRLQLPDQIADSAFVTALAAQATLIESRALATQLQPDSEITPELVAQVHHPGIALWGGLKGGSGQLLGLVVLGLRADLDPYRPADLRELQRFLDTAALALANSHAYRERGQAEELIRELYLRLQEAQDTTAAAIARALHDDVINVHVRLNIMELDRLLLQIGDPAVRDSLQRLRESERDIGRNLRDICAQLHPLGLDDPLGLPLVIQEATQIAQATWLGVCRLTIIGDVRPVAPTIQREALRIAREALTNAITHSGGTTVHVSLCYAEPPAEWIEIRVRDNGRGMPTPTQSQPGHLGLHSMAERARSVGGTLSVRPADGGGLEVIFRCAAGGALQPDWSQPGVSAVAPLALISS